MYEGDTIAAVATPAGEGGVAIVRVSGPDAEHIASRIFIRNGDKNGKLKSHRLYHGTIRDPRANKILDEALLVVMRNPRSYTGEDVVEFHCHGGAFLIRQVLGVVLAQGARPAEPGEFTKRAFLNGRIDLTQAEAVADLIHARTELSLAAANEQLAGRLSQRINQLRDDLMKTLAHVEAHIDFPDEDIAPDTKAQLLSRLQRGVEFMDELLRTANEGQILRRGIRTAII